MRSSSAIVLLFVLLAGQIGAIWILDIYAIQHERNWQSRFEFDEPAITLKIPISMPYRPDQEHFEPTDGQISHNGYPYRKIYQRYANDTVTILAVPDTKAAHLQNVKKELASQQSQQQQDTSGKTILIKILKADYQLNSFFFHVAVSFDEVNTRFAELSLNFTGIYMPISSHPPQA